MGQLRALGFQVYAADSEEMILALVVMQIAL